MWKSFFDWLEIRDEDNIFLAFIKTVIVLFNFAIFVFVCWIIWTLLSNFYKACRWEMCYSFGRCVPKEFLGNRYPAKNTTDIDYKIIDLFDAPVVILNIKSKVVHKDMDCKYARKCTENCVYMDRYTADKLVRDGIAHNCLYEFYTLQKCINKCDGISEVLEEGCIDNCIEKTYEDLPFTKYKYLEEIAEQYVGHEEDSE